MSGELRTSAPTRPSLPPGAIAFIGAQSASNACSVMELLTLSWLVLSPDELHLTASHFTLVVAGEFLPVVVVGPIYGRLARAVPPTRLWVLCLTGASFVTTALGLLLLSGVHLPFWVFVAYAAVLGTLQAVEVPSRQTILMTFLGDAFNRGYAVFASTSRAMSALAPLLVGVLIATVPIGLVFVVNGFSFAVILVVARRCITSTVVAAPPPRTQQLAQRLSTRWWQPLLALAFVIGAIGNQFPVTNVLALPHLSQDGSVAYGVVSAALAAGAVLGPLLSQRVSRNASEATAMVAVGFGIFEMSMGLFGSIVTYCLLAFGTGLTLSAFMVLSGVFPIFRTLV